MYYNFILRRVVEYMGDEYTRMSLKNDLGIHYDGLNSVRIPDKAMDVAEYDMKRYKDKRKIFHATVSGKIISTLSKISEKAKESETYKDELKRRKKVGEIIKHVYKRMQETEKYFENCKDVNIIKNYNKQIQSDCKRLKNKHYFDVDTIDKEDFDSFDETKYGLGFITESIKIPVGNGKEINLKPTGTSYKAKCMEVFTNMRTAFSIYLSYVNKIYVNKYNEIEKIPSGTINKFIDSKKTLNNALSEFERCVKEIEGEISKHRRYFNSGENKKNLEEMYSKIEEARENLKSMISQGKRINLNAEFIPITDGEDKRKYTGLVDILESINNNINKFAKYISEGSYNSLEDVYKSIVRSFEDLPKLIDDFQNAKQASKVDFDVKLESYKSALEKLMENIEKIQNVVKKFTADFKKTYGEFEKSLVKSSAKISVKTLLSIISIVIPFARQISDIFDTWTREFENLEKNSNFPTLKTS